MIQNLQGYVISPLVEGDQLDIHPLLVFVAVLVGASLGGAIGAFVAVPAAAIVDLLLLEVGGVEWLLRRDDAGDSMARFVCTLGVESAKL